MTVCMVYFTKNIKNKRALNKQTNKSWYGKDSLIPDFPLANLFIPLLWILISGLHAQQWSKLLISNCGISTQSRRTGGLQSTYPKIKTVEWRVKIKSRPHAIHLQGHLQEEQSQKQKFCIVWKHQEQKRLFCRFHGLPHVPSPTPSPYRGALNTHGLKRQRHSVTTSGQWQAKPNDIWIHSDLGGPGTLHTAALFSFNGWICHWPLSGIWLSGEKERALPWHWSKSQIRPTHHPAVTASWIPMYTQWGPYPELTCKFPSWSTGSNHCPKNFLPRTEVTKTLYTIEPP